MISFLSGSLWLLEDPAPDPDTLTDMTEPFADGFETSWAVFTIVASLEREGTFGSGGVAGQLVIVLAIVSGLMLSVMPITVVGDAYDHALKRKEMIEV